MSYNSYSVMAVYYEFLQKDANYQKWSEFILDKIKDAPNDIGVDVGCGTGIITRALFDKGYSVSGIDISKEMLSEAFSLSNGKIPYYLMSAEDFCGFSNLGFITAVNDVVNYLNKKNALKFFGKAYDALTDGGLFVFDISSEYKLKNIVANNTFTFISDDVSYIWNNELVGDKVYMDLTFFVVDKDGKYEKLTEEHLQYAHKISDILQALKSAGFKKITIKSGFGKKMTENAERITFICKK